MFQVQRKVSFNFLTLLLFLVGVFSANASVLNQSEFKTHLRWKIASSKKQLLIKKTDNTITIKTLDKQLFTDLISDLLKLDKKQQYIKDFVYSADKLPAGPAELTVNLTSDSIELFSFYKDQTNNYVLDFWENKDTVITKKAALVKQPKVLKLAKPKQETKKVAKKIEPKKINEVAKVTDVLNPENIMEKNQDKGFRDFRYGAAFVWDYPAFIPPLEKDINISIKTPDYLYEIKDRTFSNDNKESHMQLTINFYRKGQWGLMTRSITLYENKYGKDSNQELNDFLKANSLIRNVIKPSMKSKATSESEKDQIAEIKESGGVVPAHLKIDFSDKGTFQAGINILTKVAERTTNYDLKKATDRYILQYSLDRDDYISALQIAKRLYVSSTEQFDDEMIIYSSRVILNSLAHLKQLDKIKEFLSNKAVIRVLPKQEGIAYIGYVNLAFGKTNEVINQFEGNQTSFTKPIHPAILYNTAEAYYRKADYEKAIRVFDDYIANYSFYNESSNARLRVALSYDFLNKDIKKVEDLYKNAINNSADPQIRYEAKLRYVGVRAARKINPSDSDKETIVFLDQSPDERKSLNQNLRKLLWLVRLRTMINNEKYEDAIAYLSTIPLESLRLIDKRTFDGEGAEVVLGLIKSSYLKGDFARTVKLWEVYKNKYENKVAGSPYLGYMVSDAYLQLGFQDSFAREFKRLRSLKDEQERTFPRWVKIHKKIKIADYITELEIEKFALAKDWKKLEGYLANIQDKQNINYNFYKGLVSYHLKQYNNTVTSFEKVLVSPNINNSLSPEQSQLMLSTYAESLYQGNDQKRFRKNAAALINDLRRNDKPNYAIMVERMEYLYIESLFGESDTNYKLLLTKTKDFLAAHGKTSYKNRVSFLNGVALIKSSQEVEGKEILESLINNNETPEYLKGLARTELSTLAISNKTL